MTLYLQPFARWQLCWCSPQYAAARDLDFWPFDLEVGVGVACDLGYTCAKFHLPRPFGFRVRADVRDIRRTDGRTTDADHRIMPPRRGHNKRFPIFSSLRFQKASFIIVTSAKADLIWSSQFVCRSICMQNYCKNDQSFRWNSALWSGLLGYTRKNWLTSGGGPVPNTDSGSHFHFPSTLRNGGF